MVVVLVVVMAWSAVTSSAAVAGVSSARARPSVEPTAGVDGTDAVEGSDAVDTVGTGATLADEGSIIENDLGSGEDEEEGSSASEDRKIWAIIGGLLLVALALTVLTVRYWRQTRPAPRRSAASTGGRRARASEDPIEYDDLGSDLFVDGEPGRPPGSGD
jgi:hypothetical protein